MKLGVKIAIGVGAALLIGGVAFIIIRSRKKKQSEQGQGSYVGGQTSSPTQTQTASQTSAPSNVVSQGQTGRGGDAGSGKGDSTAATISAAQASSGRG